MDKINLKQKLDLLDGSGSDSEYDAVRELLKLGKKFPELLSQKYKESKKWGQRSSCVYHSMRFARENDAAFNLGIEATRDRSKHVRYRACMLLAVAQRKEALPHLEVLLNQEDSASDAEAAIDAIKHQNQHFFVDREHSGKVKLNVG